MSDAMTERLSVRVQELEAENTMLRYENERLQEKTMHRRGTCATCGRRYGLNRKGMIGSHASRPDCSWSFCRGSLQPPVEVQS